MNTVSVFNKSTGLFTGARHSSNEAGWRGPILPDGYAFVEGRYDKDKCRVDLATGQIILHVPVPDPEQVRIAALRQIRLLEKGQDRLVREAVLGDTTALVKLKNLDDQIKQLRKSL